MVQWLRRKSAEPRIGKGGVYFDTWCVAKFQGNVEVLAELER